MKTLMDMIDAEDDVIDLVYGRDIPLQTDGLKKPEPKLPNVLPTIQCDRHHNGKLAITVGVKGTF